MSAKVPVSSISELMEIWDQDANSVSPEDIGKRSDEKVWWICPNGHEHYLQSPHQKLRYPGCPKCNILKRVQNRSMEILKEKGSILITHPEIAKDWDYDKNELSPDTVLAGTHAKYWWKCALCGDSYLMSPNMRSSKYRNCPKCGIVSRGLSKKENLIKKYGSLNESHPAIAVQWDYILNDDTPDKVHQGMPEKRWWKCDYGHPSYKQAIRERVRRGYGCPICQGENQTSFPEQVIFYYIKQKYPDAQNRYISKGYEIDIYIPSLKIGIEYDGLFWHKNKQEREIKKDKYFSQQGIRIIRIKETKSETLTDNQDLLLVKATSNYKYLDDVIKNIANLLEIRIENVDTIRDTKIIWNEYLSTKAENSLQGKYPNIAAEWDYNKNIIHPDKVSPYSSKKVYWICPECGNSYEMVIGDRTGVKKCGCPICGFNRRKEMQAQIKKENQQAIYDYKLNNPNATYNECAKALGLSRTTVRKYWNSISG